MGNFRVTVAAVAFVATLVAVGATEQAQARRGGARPPGGSYLQTCRNVRAWGDRIEAVCRRKDGSWARTWLSNVSSCRGDIANRNGHLTCHRGGPRRRW